MCNIQRKLSIAVIFGVIKGTALENGHTTFSLLGKELSIVDAILTCTIIREARKFKITNNEAKID